MLCNSKQSVVGLLLPLPSVTASDVKLPFSSSQYKSIHLNKRLCNTRLLSPFIIFVIIFFEPSPQGKSFNCLAQT